MRTGEAKSARSFDRFTLYVRYRTALRHCLPYVAVSWLSRGPYVYFSFKPP